jgi:hypothetical protein
VHQDERDGGRQAGQPGVPKGDARRMSVSRPRHEMRASGELSSMKGHRILLVFISIEW